MERFDELIQDLIHAIKATDEVALGQALEKTKDEYIGELLVKAEKELAQELEEAKVPKEKAKPGILQYTISRNEEIQKDLPKLKQAKQQLEKQKTKNEKELKKSQEKHEAKTKQYKEEDKKFQEKNVINFLSGTDEEKQKAEEIFTAIETALSSAELPFAEKDEEEESSPLDPFLGNQESIVEPEERKVQLEGFLEKIKKTKSEYKELNKKVEEFKQLEVELEALNSRVESLSQSPSNDIEMQTMSVSGEAKHHLVDIEKLSEEELKARKKKTESAIEQTGNPEQKLKDFVEKEGKITIDREITGLEIRTEYINEHGELKEKIKTFKEVKDGSQEDLTKAQNSLKDGEKELEKCIENIEKKESDNPNILNKLLAQEKVAEVLLNKPDKNSRLPLEEAIAADISRKDEATPYLDVLIKYKVDVKKRTHNNGTIWHCICGLQGQGTNKVLGTLKKEIKISSDKKDHLSSDIKLLNEMGKRNIEGNTAFHVAAQNTLPDAIKHISGLGTTEEVTKELVKNLCYSKNNEGLTPFTLAIREKNIDNLEAILIDPIIKEINENELLRNEIIDECVLSGNIQALENLGQKLGKNKGELIKGFEARHLSDRENVDEEIIERIVENNNVDTVKTLISPNIVDEESDYDQINNKQWLKQKLAQAAIKVGNLEVLEHLKTIMGAQQSLDSLGNNELHILASSANPTLSILDNFGLEKIQRKNNKGETPIELAIQHSNIELANKMLLKARPMPDKNGQLPPISGAVMSALRQAAFSGNIAALQMLIKDHDTSIYQTFENDKTLIEVAARGENPQEIVKHIIIEHKKLQSQQKSSEIDQATLTFALDAEQIPEGINNVTLTILPNHGAEDWHKLLLEVAREQITEQESLENPSDPIVQDLKKLTDDGINPLSRAIQNNNYPLVEFLNQHFPDLKDKALPNGKLPADKRKPTDIATESGDREIARILGVTLNLENSFLSSLRTTHTEPSSKEAPEESVIKPQDQAPNIDDLYEHFHGKLDKYAQLLKGGKSLKDELEKIEKEKAKDLFDEKSPSGHNIATLVAAYGTVSDWKELNRTLGKIDKTERPFEYMHQLDSNFGTPMEVAIKVGNEGVIDAIQKTDPNVDILTTATKVGNVDLVRKNLDRPNSTNKKIEKVLKKQKEEGNLLYIALKNGDLPMVSELISQITESGLSNDQAKKISELLNAKDQEGFTVLHLAAKQQDSAIFNLVYNFINTVDENFKEGNLYLEHVLDNEGKSALELAAENGNTYAARTLADKLDTTIKNHQNKDFRNKATKTRKESFEAVIAQPDCSLEIAKILTSNKNLVTDEEFRKVLSKVAEQGNPKVLGYMLSDDRKVVIDNEELSSENRNQLLLEKACQSGNIQNIEFLVNEKNASLNMLGPPPSTETPFEIAVHNPKMRDWCIQYLRENHENVRPEFQLYLAAELGDLDTLEIIINNYGDNLYLRRDDTRLPIEIAEEKGHTDAVLFLADKMLTKTPDKMSVDDLEKVYGLLEKHGCCKNNDVYSQLILKALRRVVVSGNKPALSDNVHIDNILEKAIEDGNSNIVGYLADTLHYEPTGDWQRHLEKAISLKDIKNTKTTLDALIKERGVDEVSNLFKAGLLEQAVLTGNKDVFKALIDNNKGLDFLLDQPGDKKKWAITFASGGFLEELQDVMGGMSDYKQESTIQDLLQAIVTGGHATEEIVEYYKEKFPEEYKKALLSPSEKEVVKKNIILPDKTRKVELWEQAADSGNSDLAEYLRNDVRRLSKDKKGVISGKNLYAAQAINRKLLDGWNPRQNMQEQVAQIEVARNAHQDSLTKSPKGYKVEHKKTEEIQDKQAKLIKYINDGKLHEAMQVCTETPGILDIPNFSLGGKTTTERLFKSNNTKMVLGLAKYANPWITDEDGNTVLHRLLKESDKYDTAQLKATIKEIQKKGPFLNAKNENGETLIGLITEKFGVTDSISVQMNQLARKETENDLKKAYDENNATKLGDYLKNDPFKKNPLSYVSKVALRCLDEDLIESDKKDDLNERTSDLGQLLKKNNKEGTNSFSGNDEKGNNLFHILCKKAANSTNQIKSSDVLVRVINTLIRDQNFKLELLGVKNIDNETPLDILARNPQSLQAFRAFERDKRNKGLTPKEMIEEIDLNHLFRKAAKHGNLDLCKHLLNGGKYRNIDIESSGDREDDDPALIQAARNEQEEIVNYLLGEGADIENTDREGGTVLEILLDKMHSGNVESLETTLGLIHRLVRSGASLTTHKDGSHSSAMDTIQAIEKAAISEQENLKNKQDLSEADKKQQAYADAVCNITQNVLEQQKILLDKEERLNDELKKYVAQYSEIHKRHHIRDIPILGKVPLLNKTPTPFSGAEEELGNKIANIKVKDGDLTARIKGDVVELTIHNPEGKLQVSGFLKTLEGIEGQDIRNARISGKGYEATVQKATNGKRNYTVESGEIKLTVKGIDNKPPELRVWINADGELGIYNKNNKQIRTSKESLSEFLKDDEKQGLKNVYVGGIKLLDALEQGRWRDYNRIPKRSPAQINKENALSSQSPDLQSPPQPSPGVTPQPADSRVVSTTQYTSTSHPVSPPDRPQTILPNSQSTGTDSDGVQEKSTASVSRVPPVQQSLQPQQGKGLIFPKQGSVGEPNILSAAKDLTTAFGELANVILDSQKKPTGIQTGPESSDNRFPTIPEEEKVLRIDTKKEVNRPKSESVLERDKVDISKYHNQLFDSALKDVLLGADLKPDLKIEKTETPEESIVPPVIQVDQKWQNLSKEEASELVNRKTTTLRSKVPAATQPTSASTQYSANSQPLEGEWKRPVEETKTDLSEFANFKFKNPKDRKLVTRPDSEESELEKHLKNFSDKPKIESTKANPTSEAMGQLSAQRAINEDGKRRTRLQITPTSPHQSNRSKPGGNKPIDEVHPRISPPEKNSAKKLPGKLNSLNHLRPRGNSFRQLFRVGITQLNSLSYAETSELRKGFSKQLFRGGLIQLDKFRGGFLEQGDKGRLSLDITGLSDLFLGSSALRKFKSGETEFTQEIRKIIQKEISGDRKGIVSRVIMALEATRQESDHATWFKSKSELKLKLLVKLPNDTLLTMNIDQEGSSCTWGKSQEAGRLLGKTGNGEISNELKQAWGEVGMKPAVVEIRTILKELEKIATEAEDDEKIVKAIKQIKELMPENPLNKNDIKEDEINIILHQLLKEIKGTSQSNNIENLVQKHWGGSERVVSTDKTSKEKSELIKASKISDDFSKAEKGHVKRKTGHFNALNQSSISKNGSPSSTTENKPKEVVNDVKPDSSQNGGSKGKVAKIQMKEALESVLTNKDIKLDAETKKKVQDIVSGLKTPDKLNASAKDSSDEKLKDLIPGLSGDAKKQLEKIISEYSDGTTLTQPQSCSSQHRESDHFPHDSSRGSGIGIK